MQRLILMRHAEAEARAASGRDRDRALSEQGRADAARMGWTLRSRGLRPDVALVSGATRTRQTFELIQDATGDVDLRLDDSLYEADAEGLRQAIEAAGDEAGCLILVGHNPAIHQLAHAWLSRSADDPAATDRLSGGFPPAAAAVFTVDTAGRPVFEAFLSPLTGAA